ncbi:MAG: lactate utilization protein [Bacteroidetes bacterium]|nr:lactate utilization protein [Bacteroidota bacterium]MBU1578361.1 lactate utilization protein [Bacteroidota bacterium]MBU2558998.1 lactate utilization protein [Bacteroidota bacterium]
MEETTSREQILTKIRNALIDKTDMPYPDVNMTTNVMHQPNKEEGLEVIFAQELIKAKGNFIYCENEIQFIEYLKSLLIDKEWPGIWTVNQKAQQVLKAGNIAFSSEPLKELNPLVGLVNSEKLIAQTGTILLSDQSAGSRSAIALPDVQLVLAYASQVVLSLKDALHEIKLIYPDRLPTQLSFVTGPSRTADIEKTLVMGAHGPKELYLFMIDDI